MHFSDLTEDEAIIALVDGWLNEHPEVHDEFQRDVDELDSDPDAYMNRMFEDMED